MAYAGESITCLTCGGSGIIPMLGINATYPQVCHGCGGQGKQVVHPQGAMAGVRSSDSYLLVEDTMGAVVRCKLRVSSVNPVEHDDAGTIVKTSEAVTLDAVYGADQTENAQWAKYTPSAHFTMQIDNPGAFDQFAVGQEFYVDFTPAPDWPVQ